LRFPAAVNRAYNPLSGAPVRTHKSSSVQCDPLRAKPNGSFRAAQGFLQRKRPSFSPGTIVATDGFESFFLSLLSNSRHRRRVRRERREALADATDFTRSPATTSPKTRWDAFLLFLPGDRSGNGSVPKPHPQLLLSLIAKAWLRTSRRSSWPAQRFAGSPAPSFHRLLALFGRNWGGDRTSPFRHLRSALIRHRCCDRRRLKTVEAGAQGEHKIARGYLPQTTYSAPACTHTPVCARDSDYLRLHAPMWPKPGANSAKPGTVSQPRLEHLEEPPCRL